MRLVGYCNRLSVAPGENIAFMVSCEFPTYQADVVRLIHGDGNPAGPGLKTRKVVAEVSGEYPGKVQRLVPGSYARIPFVDRLELGDSFTVHMWVRPTLPDKKVQTLISAVGASGVCFAVRLTDARLSVQLGTETTCAMLDRRVTAQGWYSVSVVYDGGKGEMRLAIDALELTATRLSAATVLPVARTVIEPADVVLIGAEISAPQGPLIAGSCYNGKIEAPKIYRRALSESELDKIRNDEPLMVEGLVAAWDFAQDIGSSRITDVSGRGHHGYTVNRPTRAVVGRTWDGSEVVWTHAPSQYAAIHFHDDDLDDAGWEKSLDWTVPDGTSSGIYALHIRAEGEEDYIPFAVRPRLGTATARIAFLMPTFSYLAYGNCHMAGRPDVIAMAKMLGAVKIGKYPATPQDKYIVANRLNSLYDTHTDGSGCSYASWLRPLVSMRPGHVGEIMGAKVPHQLSADLHLVDWLHEQGYEVDVIADENLHVEGRALLDHYRVVLTGTHPEYWSQQMIHACQQYLHDGGRMMYLGGNGMYWVAQPDAQALHTLEMRRVQPSAPHFFDPHPGELHLSTTGQRAAPWRHRGLPSQSWLGVVMSGAGRMGQHYVRSPQGFDARVAWIFEGIGRNELIGNFKNLHCGYGAAGGEVDRVDMKIEGTPHHTMILAATAPLDSSWLPDPVEATHSPRGNIALLEYPNEGAVFSVGSIAWCSCLSFNGYNNNVARLTKNVLEGFLNREVLLVPPA